MNPSDVRLDPLGFPIPVTFENLSRGSLPAATEDARAATASATTAGTPRRTARGTFAIRAFLVMVAVGAGIMALVRAELGEPLSRAVAEWLAGHAGEKRAEDDLDGALRDLDRAIAWSDNSPTIFALRGQVRLEKGDLTGSLTDFNKLVSMVPHSSRAYELRSASLQRLKRHQDAVRDLSQAVEMRQREPRLLNARAYTRAVAGIELDQALEDVEAAIRLEGENAAYLDTRGYLLYLLGEHERALVDLNQAVALAEQDDLSGFMLAGQSRVLAREKRLRSENLAVIYHHRGQIHEKLGHDALAQADLRRGLALGYNPEAGVY